MNKTISTLSIAILLFPASFAQADIIYESATGNTNTNTGVTVSQFQYFGSRFSIVEKTYVTSVGGTFNNFFNDDDTLFAAIVEMNGLLPAGLPLSGTEVLGTVTFRPTKFGDSIAQLDLTLDPGNYSLIFGSGRFGASGSDAMPRSGVDTPEGVGSYFFFSTGNGTWLNSSSNNARFIVNGTTVPEPGSIMLVAVGGLAICLRRCRQPYLFQKS